MWNCFLPFKGPYFSLGVTLSAYWQCGGEVLRLTHAHRANSSLSFSKDSWWCNFLSPASRQDAWCVCVCTSSFWKVSWRSSLQKDWAEDPPQWRLPNVCNHDKCRQNGGWVGPLILLNYDRLWPLTHSKADTHAIGRRLGTPMSSPKPSPLIACTSRRVCRCYCDLVPALKRSLRPLGHRRNWLVRDPRHGL